MPNVKTKLPDTSQAERWVDDQTFVYQGKLYRFIPGLEVVPIDEPDPLFDKDFHEDL
jgi:hypothetical protein